MIAQRNTSYEADNVSLYQQALLKHHKSPAGFEVKLSTITHQSNGENAACGDEISVTAQVVNGLVSAVAFAGDSCAICRASASIMCQHFNGVAVETVQENIDTIIMVISHDNSDQISFSPNVREQLSPLLAVRKFPVRKQCAILPWQTLLMALK